MQLLPLAHASSPLAHYQRDETLGQALLPPLTLQNLAPTECVEGPLVMQGPRTKSRGPLSACGRRWTRPGRLHWRPFTEEKAASEPGIAERNGGKCTGGMISSRELQRIWAGLHQVKPPRFSIDGCLNRI